MQLSNTLEIGVLIPVVYCALLSRKKREGALFAFLLFDAWVFEWVVLMLLGEVSYTKAFFFNILNIPLFVVCGWAVLLYLFLHSLRLYKDALPKAILIATVMVTIDFFLDPVAVRLGLWTWVHPQGFFGIPYNNFFGWFCYSFLMTLAVQHFYVSGSIKGLFRIFAFVSLLGLGFGLIWYSIPFFIQAYLWWIGYSLVFAFTLVLLFKKFIFSR